LLFVRMAESLVGLARSLRSVPLKGARGMISVIVLLALSALIGLALGASFSWFAIVISSVVLAVIFAATLQIQGFGAVVGIVILAACLAVNQMAYLVGVFFAGLRSERLIQRQANVAAKTVPPPI
jgi:hypothetical protein